MLPDPPIYMNGHLSDMRTFGSGLGQLSPLLNMGSSIAGIMGHNQLANALGSVNSLMGSIGNVFPKTNSIASGPFALGGGFTGGSQGYGYNQSMPFGLGAPLSSPFTSQGSGWNTPGYLFGLPQGGGFGSPPYTPIGTQSPGFGGLLSSLFPFQGSIPGYGTGMPGFL
ncbi:MAG: hypothetical protein ACO1OC_10000 [Tuberibacillus sp.]